MNKKRIFGIVICMIALVIGALWFYWGWSVSLGDLIPEEEWAGMELEQMAPTNLNGDIRFEELPVENILTQIQAARVSRDKENRLLDDECFRITLYKEEGGPTVLYVTSTGGVHVAADMQVDDWKYYEGGEVLYVYLSALSQTLPAVYPVG